MIISESKNFIYFRSLKTASTSLEIALSKHLDKKIDSLGKEEFSYNPDIDETKFEVQPFNYISKNHKLTEHASIKSMKKYFPLKKDLLEYFTFTTIRNPFDFYVSFYEWYLFLKDQYYIKYNGLFYKLILNVCDITNIIAVFEILTEVKNYFFLGVHRWQTILLMFCCILLSPIIMISSILLEILSRVIVSFVYVFIKCKHKGLKKKFTLFIMCNPFLLVFALKGLKATTLYKKKPIINYYLRFENLEEDYKKLCSKLDISYKTLPKIKSKLRLQKKEKIHYRHYYNRFTKWVLNLAFKDYLRIFNYKF